MIFSKLAKTAWIGSALFFISLTSFAADPVNTTVFGVAIKGYDPVAYFTASKPVKGNKKFQYKYEGADWRFASQANLDLFKKDPQKYTPQYGGYCAWAVSQNSTAGIDPASWKIVDDKLYLNYSKKIQKKWETDIPGHIKLADKNWPGLIAK